jgi:hypothetical protein
MVAGSTAREKVAGIGDQPDPPRAGFSNPGATPK